MTKVRHILFSLFAGGLVTAAQAQDIQTQVYFPNVRGWEVSSILYNGSYGGCITRPLNAHSQAPALGRENGVWYLISPSSQPDGGWMQVDLAVDRANFQENAQVGYGVTAIEMSHDIAVAIARGKWLSAWYEGGSYRYSLTGSTAAMLKVEECDDRQGQIASIRPAPITPRQQNTDISSIGWIEPGHRVSPPYDSDATFLGANCPQYGEYQSLASTNGAFLHLKNNSNRAAKLFWIDFDGHNREWGTAGPGQTIDLQTYEHHSWLLKTYDGECLGGRLIVMGTGDQYLTVQ